MILPFFIIVGLAVCLANNCVGAAQALFAEVYDNIADLAQSVRQLSTSSNSGGTQWWIEPRKQTQSNIRGWANSDIQDVLDNPVNTAAGSDRTSGNAAGEPATYYYRKDGHYVVRNNRTGKIVQISDTNDPQWIDETTNQPVYPR